MARFLTYFVRYVVYLLPILTAVQADAQPPYQACPLLTAYYPPPTLDKSSDVIKSFTANFTNEFDELVRTGKHEVFGAITPNTTSFSVVLFSGTKDAVDDPLVFEYHHTAAAAQVAGEVTADTILPAGSLTPLFTIFAWLVEMGDQHWETPVTQFLPQLTSATDTANGITIDWNEITIGSLAGYMSGLPRDSFACELGSPCDIQKFLDKLNTIPPLFLPDTSPVVSNAAFQLLAFALTAQLQGLGDANAFSMTLSKALFQPLNMTRTSLLGDHDTTLFGDGLNTSAPGEQAAFSLLSTTTDLARAGNAILSSRLLPPAVTRRWLKPTTDTSNLRNGVGRPWEIYRAASTPIDPIVDTFLKSGSVANYASYFGVVPDLNAGFAILAHDTTGSPDLNVYADVVSGAVGKLVSIAAVQAGEQYGGVYAGEGGSEAIFSVGRDGPGLVVEKLVVNGTDVRGEVAQAAGIEAANLDWRLYPSNVGKGATKLWVGVVQDRTALVDAGTPTCITWMTVDTLPRSVPTRFVFEVDEMGRAVNVSVLGKGVSLTRAK